MKLKIQCSNCEFNFNGICAGHGNTYKYGEAITDLSKSCDDWGANLEYFTEITNLAPWYIKMPYEKCKISYNEFINLLKNDEQGVPIEVNIYDAIENIYGLNTFQLAELLNVSVGVIGYAKTRGTNEKRLHEFSNKLYIPREYFNHITTQDFEEIKKCKMKFDKLINIKG